MLRLSLVAPQPDFNVQEFYLYDRRATMVVFRRRWAVESGGLGGVGTLGGKVLAQGGWFAWGRCVGSVMCTVARSNHHFYLFLSL